MREASGVAWRPAFRVVDPMKIACIASNELRPHTRARAHARALAAAGHDVLLVGTAAPGLELEEEDGPVLLVRVDAHGPEDDRPGAAWRASRWRRRFQPLVQAALDRARFDALHAFGLEVAGPVVDAARRHGLRCVVDDPGTTRADVVERRVLRLQPGARRTATELLVRVLRRGVDALQRDLRSGGVDAFVTAGTALAEEARRRFGGPPPAVVRDCFLSAPRRTSDRLRARLGTFPDVRLIAVRDGDTGMTAAVRALRMVDDRSALVVLGRAALPEEVVRVAREERVADRVRCVPQLPQVETLEMLASADAALLPGEPVDRVARLVPPASLYECLAAAVPIVASALASTADVVRETGAGVLYTARHPSDPGAVAEALRTVLDDPALAAACREQARAATSHGLSWDRESARLAGVYARLVSVA